MALIDNMSLQPIPVVIIGSQTASGGLVSGAGSSARQFTSVTNTLITTNGQSFNIQAGQKALVQSWDDEAVFVKLGAGVTTTDASFILAAGTAATDGKGGSYMIDDYAGVVTVTAAATVRCNVALYTA